MATVVNQRDVILQAVPAAQRVATVTMADNIQVNQSNVSGLGLAVEGAKSVWLAATDQVFKTDTLGVTTPSSIVMTVNTRNLSNSPVISVQSGTATIGALIDGVLTILPANISSTSATIRVTVTEGGSTYTDDLTIVKVTQGASSVSTFLTNESHIVPSDSAGNVLNYLGAFGQFKVYSGDLDVTNTCTFAISSNTDNLTCSIVPSGPLAGKFDIVGGMPVDKTSTTVTFTATYGSNSYSKTFTLRKFTASGAVLRSARSFHVPLTGATVTWSNSLATTAVSVEGGPVRLDVVTQYNSSMGYSETKLWDGASWISVNAVVDGNLLVDGTVAAKHIVANTFQSDNVLTRGLTVRAADGTIILSAGVPLNFDNVGGTNKPANNATVGATIGTNLNGQFTAGNIATYMAAGVITNAYIGNFIQSTNFNGTIDSNGNITANGTVGWAIGKGGKAVFQDVVARGDIEATSLNAATGTFSGSLSAATGSFSGSLSAATGTFAGTLTAAAINAVDTLNIKGNAVTVPLTYDVTSTFTGNGAEQEVLSFSFPMDAAGKVIVMWQSRHAYFASTEVNWEIFLNDVSIGKGNAGGDYTRMPMAFGFGNVTSGTNVIKVKWSASSAVVLGAADFGQKLIVLGAKR